MVDYLIIARSGRALASSAKRAGYKVSVADCFSDEDTKSIAESVHQIQIKGDRFVAEPLIKHIQEVVSRSPNVKLIPASGFESSSELLKSLAKVAPVLSNSEESIVALKDPINFFNMLDRNAIAHPRVFISRPKDPENYLKKKIGGTGGDHVSWCNQVNSRDDSDCYYQEFISGVTFSVVFLANGVNAKIVGFNQQLQTNAFADMPFLYQGAITRDNNEVEERNNIEDIINKITKETGLTGLCGLDYIIDEGGQIQVLEVNPRPPATFELHERQQPLFDAHLDCFDGSLPDYKSENGKEMSGYVILYAKENMFINDKVKWPDWIKDRPSIGSVVPVRFPICTVHSQETSLDKVKNILINRLQHIESIIIAMQNARS
jgi:uncharacterized protein